MGHINLDLLMEQLGREKIDSILLEGGGTLNWGGVRGWGCPENTGIYSTKAFWWDNS